jgi:isocitrate dehydrogenase (NAD+)
LLLSACLLLEHVEQREVASRVRDAIDTVIQAGESLTVDMGGGASTKEYTQALLRALR